MKQRIITGAFISLILFILIFFSNNIYVSCLLASVLSVFSIYELFRLVGYHQNEKVLIFYIIISFVFSFLSFNNFVELEVIVVFLFLTLFIFLIVEFTKVNQIAKWLILVVGLFVILMFKAIPEITRLNEGKLYLCIGVLICGLTDIFSLIMGKLFGKMPLCKNISPKKTIEGAIGGTMCSTLIVLLICFLIGLCCDVCFNYINLVLVSLIVSIAGHFGDISMSIIKRKTYVKDFSDILPGHGGILDRFDSMLLGLPMMYLLILLGLNFII